MRMAIKIQSRNHERKKKKRPLSKLQIQGVRAFLQADGPREKERRGEEIKRC